MRENELIYKTYTRIFGYLYSSLFNQVKNFCIFIGYPRSGSSIIGSIIDSHKNALISHELNILDYYLRGYTQNQIFYLIKRNSRIFKHLNRLSAGYPGIIPNQWNGEFSKICLIGDKRAGGSSKIVFENPKILISFQNSLKINLKILHVIRNPFDIIATEAKGGTFINKEITEQDIWNKIDFFFQKLDTISILKSRNQYDILDIKLEELIRNPKNMIERILDFLELENYNKYIEDCTKILFKDPHITRYTIPWASEQINKINLEIKKYSILKGYTYEE
ncbi:hypothetical protein ES705_14369 [subsurface metagenome]